MCYVKLSRNRPDFEKLSRDRGQQPRTLYSSLVFREIKGNFREIKGKKRKIFLDFLTFYPFHTYILTLKKRRLHTNLEGGRFHEF